MLCEQRTDNGQERCLPQRCPVFPNRRSRDSRPEQPIHKREVTQPNARHEPRGLTRRFHPFSGIILDDATNGSGLRQFVDTDMGRDTLINSVLRELELTTYNICANVIDDCRGTKISLNLT